MPYSSSLILSLAHKVHTVTSSHMTWVYFPCSIISTYPIRFLFFTCLGIRDIEVYKASVISTRATLIADISYDFILYFRIWPVRFIILIFFDMVNGVSIATSLNLTEVTVTDIPWCWGTPLMVTWILVTPGFMPVAILPELLSRCFHLHSLEPPDSFLAP